ncbi:HlyC/CorC family transporter [Nordella sp. HKS 07]|uniref:hemolysin family protein n=1 Tax=Nordella sp. HKS 07 TaxID=2712222 RepID=UPI0013E1440C|nr:hemolysin family protein [Nordella sp. HKS 07]QIG48766.1 HlyC/CorC family transporter [Nordella sp. HKS 07]
MSDIGPSPKPDSLLSRLKGLFSSDRDATLRQSLEGVIASHDAQNPADMMRAEAKSMMLNLIKFADLRVDDVMVPRADIVAIESSATIKELLDRFIDANHSRMPVYRETLDDLSGMIHIKDLVRWLAQKGAKTRRRKGAKDSVLAGLSLSATDLATEVSTLGIVREVLFVPPSMPAADLLIKMQSTHIHIAIVVDEYGGTDGLVSIEDLVEQIVGDISDEHDSDEELIVSNGDGTFTASARADLQELEQMLGVDFLPEERDEETDTLGGLIFSMFGRVPVRGELLRHNSGIEFEILEADPRRVKRVKIRSARPEAETPAEAAAEKDTTG